MILKDYVAKSTPTQTQTQTQTHTDGKPITAYQLMTQIEKDKSVKVVSFDVPYRKDICLYDISLDARGQDEDKVYAFNEWFRTHIRRGNTVIQTFDSNDKVIETFYGRRGFEKFFDLTYEYMQYNLGEIKDLESHGIKQADEHYGLHHIIFNGAQQAIKSGKKVAVYKEVKANGENAQVAWVSRLGAWLVASKNVSLLARTEKDVETYTGERFHFAKLIAKEWFRIIDRIEKEGKIEELKKYMTDKTFVGEYCGNQQYQHLVKYTQVDIHFTAIVENNSTVTSLSPVDAFAVFDKYKLTHVSYEKAGVYDNWQALNVTLKKLYSDVARAHIDSEEEGSVIYLTQVDSNGKEEVLSLSKLKTLEYRIYRKLREKLKRFINQPGKKYKPWAEFYKAFQSETKDLCLENQPPLPLSYYFKVAQKAFEFAENHFKDCHLVHEQYITFLSLLMYHMSKNIELTPAAFVKETIDKVLPLKWTEYSKNYVEEAEHEEKSQATGTAKKVYVIVPIGMPGMGKTFFLKTLRKNLESLGCFLSIISSDEVRAECMERLAKTQRKLTRDQLFDKTGRDARNLFNERLSNLIATGGDKKDCSAHFIFIDKNHPPNAIKGTLDLIKQSGQGVNLEVIALTPQVEDDFFLYVDQGRTHKYPFSANFFFNCFDRVQHRLDHPTLPGSGSKSANVLVMFFHMFRNIKLNKDSVLKNGFDRHLAVPFTNETKPTTIPAELNGAFIDVLKATQPGETCNDANLIETLNNTNEKSRLKFNHPDPAQVDKIIHTFVKEEILPSLTASKTSLVEVAVATGIEKANEAIKNGELQKPKMEEEKKEVAAKVEKKQSQEHVYNPKKLPVYLGIFAVKDPFYDVKDFVLDGLDRLCNMFPKDKILEDAYYDISDKYYKQLAFVKDFHVTTLFIGKDKTKTETEHFKSFKPGHKMSLEITGFVIVPGKIATAICYPDQSKIKIENTFPHMTLMTGKWPAKESNQLFETLFGSNGPLTEQYNSRKQELVDKVTVTINKNTENAYIVTRKPLKIAMVADEYH